VRRFAVSLVLITAGLSLGAAAYARPHAQAHLYIRPKPLVLGLFFNPTSPLFANNPDLERAINYALDRPALVRAQGAHAGRPIAQMIPPLVPGYDAASPYPLTGPNFESARKLADGNLRSGKATLLWGLSPASPLAAEVTRELAALGLAVTVSPIRGCRDSCEEPDMALTAWGPAYPDGVAALRGLVGPEQIARIEKLSGAARNQMLARIDDDVMTFAPPVAPFMAANAAVLVSARTHCFRWNLYYGADLSTLCVR
jgi:hypothetical protein